MTVIQESGSGQARVIQSPAAKRRIYSVVVDSHDNVDDRPTSVSYTVHTEMGSRRDMAYFPDRFLSSQNQI